MPDNFEQISTKSGFMKHNGGLLVKKLSENEFQFKAKVTSNHLNRAGITHGGYIASIIDAGCGSLQADQRPLGARHWRRGTENCGEPDESGTPG